MKIIFSLLAFLFFGCSLGIAQNSYSTTIDFFNHSQELGLDIVVYNGRTFVLNGNGCPGSECGSIMEVDENGNLLWVKYLPWMDPGFVGLAIQGDTLLVGGYEHIMRSSMYVYQSSLDGDSLGVITLSPSTDFPELLATGMVTYGNDVIVYGGNLISIDSIHFPGVLYWVSDGQPDSIIHIYPEDSLSYSYVHEAKIDSDGLLTVHAESNTWTLDPDDDYYLVKNKSIHKFNAQKEKVWSWTKDFPDNSVLNSTQMTIAPNGQMIIIGEGLFADFDELWSINKFGGSAWKYKFDIMNGLRDFGIRRINMAENGDILAVGDLYSPNDFEGSAGYIIRLDSFGQKKWDRVFIDSPQSNSSLLDVIELPDGDILATGRRDVWHEDAQGSSFMNTDTWLLRLTADGCLEADCEFIHDFTSSITSRAAAANIKVFPNPTTGYIYLDYPAEMEIVNIKLVDVLGKTIHVQEKYSPIYTGNYEAGMYWLLLTNDEGRRFAEQVIIAK